MHESIGMVISLNVKYIINLDGSQKCLGCLNFQKPDDNLPLVCIDFEQVGMEYWARWAHKALWHASLWNMHEVCWSVKLMRGLHELIGMCYGEDWFASLFANCFMCVSQSHHKPREGPFELNDVFAIINAVPAIALMAYGFFHKGLAPGLCFGAVSLECHLFWIIYQILVLSPLICNWQLGVLSGHWILHAWKYSFLELLFCADITVHYLAWKCDLHITAFLWKS